MSISQPFSSDQAEGLRKLFAGKASAIANVIAFLSIERESGASTAIQRIALALQKQGKSVLVVDEQSQQQASLKLLNSSDSPFTLIERPKAAGPSVSHQQLQETDFVLIDAYPSKESLVKQANTIVVVSKSPIQNEDRAVAIMRATSKTQAGTTLLLSQEGDSTELLKSRSVFEKISLAMNAKKIGWLGALPMRSSTSKLDEAAYGLAQRIISMHQAQEL